jgi:fructokinase
MDDLTMIAEELAGAARPDKRLIVAIAAPPGAGKSTFAEALALRLKGAAVIPMDGYHLDNSVLEARGLLARKGAPETFDAAGFEVMISRLRREEEVVIPVFDRGRDLAIAGARVIGPEARILLVEGNYLLLDQAPWDRLAGLWDRTIWIDVPLPELEARLIRRWRGHGLSEADARARALGNDIPNAGLVCAGSRKADWVLSQK